MLPNYAQIPPPPTPPPPPQTFLHIVLPTVVFNFPNKNIPLNSADPSSNHLSSKTPSHNIQSATLQYHRNKIHLTLTLYLRHQTSGTTPLTGALEIKSMDTARPLKNGAKMGPAGHHRRIVPAAFIV
jgi:hypothetical protein